MPTEAQPTEATSVLPSAMLVHDVGAHKSTGKWAYQNGQGNSADSTRRDTQNKTQQHKIKMQA